ncbi:YbjN domain-containing protein [Rahnella sp. AA]|uniref:YbjN domain-containing protein n=1 Tax=Rahnella sp. AA TaxID=2057180 RepID=UPI000C33A384|nr:YbjN domain-containing protein [Rahnella sp. AA]PKE31044.1 YbjN domain-containing protein [Rahnella sp. AA]
MDSLIVPDLALLRRWLDQLGISFFECDSCQALHLPHMQNFDGIFDAKLDIVDNVILFSALAEVKPTALIPLVADLSSINASSLTIKAFVDIQDDNLPKLIVCQSLTIAVGVTEEQFAFFLQQAEEQMSMIILEAHANDLLFLGDDDEEGTPVTAVNVPLLH